MNSLKETIENFHDYILEKNTDIEQEIIGPDQAFKETRLSVYQEGYFLRLVEGLARDFRGIQKLAGEEAFEALGYEYIRTFPSTHFSIRYVGQHFAKFLANKGADPLWIEMATFEWTLENAIDAKDAPTLTFDEMASLSPEDWSALTLQTHPSLEVLPLHYLTPRLWQHLLQDAPKPTQEYQDNPTYWLIWRFNYKSYFRPMDEHQYWMMRSIQAGRTFSDVCTGLCEFLEEEKVVPFAAETLRTWIVEGVFSGFVIDRAKEK